MTTTPTVDADGERRFLDRVRAALPDPSAAARYAIAYSGGLDSTVLLAALVRIHPPASVRALHVDHGLHTDSVRWAQHCERASNALGVASVSLRVHVDRHSGRGIEAAARRARYAALAEQVHDGEILLTAHHADDQLETVLLRLLRGAGVRGLRGVLPLLRIGTMRVARPLLGFTRADLAAAAEHWGLEWLDDPSNASLDFDRNFVRARVAPVLRERWGDAVAHRASRLAAAMGDAESILADVAEQDLAAASADPTRMPLAPLRALGAARQRNLLRHAIRTAGLPMPSARRLEALRRALGDTPEQAVPGLAWPGAEARIHRDRLYLRAAAEPSARRPREALHPANGGATGAAAFMRVSAAAPWRGPEGQLVLEPCAPGDRGLPRSWAEAGLEVRFRRGGERFKPAGAAHHRTLKAWLRERGVVPWLRDRVPLLYRGDHLVAVADLCLDDGACRAEPDEPRWCVRWLEPPRID